MGRGKSQRNIELIETAYEILEAIQPASVRAVCYQLFIRGVISSMARNHTARVSAQLTDAREHGAIPWHWIVDESREAERVASWKDPKGFAAAAQRSYRRDLWADQPKRVEVWSEKGTIRGTLLPILQKFGVTFRVFHGHASATVVRDMVEEHLEHRKPFLALYVGDHDCSGMRMSEDNLPARLANYWWQFSTETAANLEQSRDVEDPTLERIALRDEDGPAMPEGLSFSAHDKRQDPNYRWYLERYGERCWELDAMDPRVLRKRVEQAIRKQIKWKPWRRGLTCEKAEQDTLKVVLGNWHNPEYLRTGHEIRPAEDRTNI